MNVFLKGRNIIHVLDASDPANLIEIYHMTLGYVELTDVEFCGNYIFTTQSDKETYYNGTVVIYDQYDRQNNVLTEVLSFVGKKNSTPVIVFESHYCFYYLYELCLKR